jgi:uncharacterized protein (AIM24 family)
LLLVQTSQDPPRAFAVRVDAVRVVAGPAVTHVLRRRIRDADTGEVLGGPDGALVRFEGNAQLVVGPRSSGSIVLLGLEDELAFVREESLLGFELTLSYECGRLALDPPGESAPSGADPSPIVQLRGTGGLALEIAGALASLPSALNRPLIVRREWVVGWAGRLMPRALGPAEAPNGQRGLVSFSGEGAVLVRVGR